MDSNLQRGTLLSTGANVPYLQFCYWKTVLLLLNSCYIIIKLYVYTVQNCTDETTGDKIVIFVTLVARASDQATTHQPPGLVRFLI
jgi:hypothetical protein